VGSGPSGNGGGGGLDAKLTTLLRKKKLTLRNPKK
jgi:hypothetical protein